MLKCTVIGRVAPANEDTSSKRTAQSLRGVHPDVLVEVDPDDFYPGNDPEFDAALSSIND